MGAVHVHKQDFSELERVTIPAKALKDEQKRKRKERAAEDNETVEDGGQLPPNKKPRKTKQ